MLNYSLVCSCSKKLSSFWLELKQQWTIEEISIFSNSSHLEWRAELSDTILKGIHPGTIPARLGLIWFSGFRGEDLNVKVYDVRRTDGRTDGRTTTDAKWWKKLTWPLARWAKNEPNIVLIRISYVSISYTFSSHKVVSNRLEND
jgi:hypothetical protein